MARVSVSEEQIFDYRDMLKRTGYDDVEDFTEYNDIEVEKMISTLIAEGMLEGHSNKLRRRLNALQVKKSISQRAPVKAKCPNDLFAKTTP